MAGIINAVRSEAFHRDEQIAAARKLRERMTPDELRRAMERAALRKKAAAPTVDNLAEVMRHTVATRLMENGSQQSPRPPLSTKSNLRPYQPWTNPASVAAAAKDINSHAGGGWAQEVNSAVHKAYRERFTVMQNMAVDAQRSAISPAKAAAVGEGVIAGASAFLIASTMVGAVGAIGLMYLATHPSVIDQWRESTKVFFTRLDGSVGEMVRQKLPTPGSADRQEGESMRKAREVAQGVLGSRNS